MSDFFITAVSCCELNKKNILIVYNSVNYHNLKKLFLKFSHQI